MNTSPTISPAERDRLLGLTLAELLEEAGQKVIRPSELIALLDLPVGED